jgi:Domain of unknown function (DUF892)
MADKKTIEDLLEDEIKDLYSAEKQLTKAIPRKSRAAHTVLRFSPKEVRLYALGRMHAARRNS